MPKTTITDDASALTRTTHGVLSCIDAEGLPYAVALNAVYCPEENCLFFHCALTGRKLDAIDANSRVAYFAIADEQLIPDHFTTSYTSVLAEGTAHRITDDAEAKRALTYLTEALAPGALDRHPGVIEGAFNRCLVYRIDIERATCKVHG